jgi:transcriptional regulator with XRE-family HTH domain
VEPDWRIFLKQALERQGVPQKTLARSIGRSYNTWNNWFKTQPQGEPTISDAIRIAEKLQLTLDELFRGIRLSASEQICARLAAEFAARGIIVRPPPPSAPTAEAGQ